MIYSLISKECLCLRVKNDRKYLSYLFGCMVGNRKVTVGIIFEDLNKRLTFFLLRNEDIIKVLRGMALQVVIIAFKM